MAKGEPVQHLITGVEHQLGLGAEVVVDRLLRHLGHLGHLGDLRDGDVFETVLKEQPHRRVGKAWRVRRSFRPAKPSRAGSFTDGAALQGL